MLCTKREPERKSPTNGAEAVLKIFVDANLHNDRLIWSQLQTMIALQGATLTGGYLLRGTALSWIVVLLGIVFMLLLYLYVERLHENRDVNMPIVDQLLNEYADSELKVLMGEVDGKRLRLAAPRPKGKLIFWNRSVRGKTLLVSAFALFFLVDLGALFLFPCLPKAM